MTSAQPKTSTAAIWSLILGIVSIGLCLSVFAAIPGLILGIVALVNIGKSPSNLKGKGAAIGGIVTSAVGILMFPVVISVSLPVYNRTTERARLMKSVAHADQIVAACKLYALRHDGDIPPDVGALLDVGLVTEETLESPVDRSDSTSPDYELLLDGKLDDYPEDARLVRDLHSVRMHSGMERRVIGFTGGQVQILELPLEEPES